MKPIQIKNLSLLLPHKDCFSDFSTDIYHGSRIAIIGENGSGKSSLIKMLQGIIEPPAGQIRIPENTVIGYVPQIIEEFADLSGGQRLNKSLSQALALDPDILLLDEPTNHLDLNNKKSLMRWLRSYTGTLIIVSHDLELLRNHIDILWHVSDGKIEVFSGNYDDYMREIAIKRAATQQKLSDLNYQRKDAHQSLMREQQRAKNSRRQGEKSISQRKWPTVVSNAKADRAAATSGKKKKAINHQKEELIEQLSELRLPEIIKPKFCLNTENIGLKTLISISDGIIYYQENQIILQSINFLLNSNGKIAINGDNASGKSSLIKAILSDPKITKLGDWTTPKITDIGYLDQHYNNLESSKTVFETIQDTNPNWSNSQIRCHLNDFLFKKNEEINNQTSNLSGGEKARLSLAKIAAKTPKLLILDEITNNLDLKTRNHIVQILKEYPGSVIVISHDQDFLQEIGVRDFYQIRDKALISEPYNL
jgi:ATPase subunit of ABC transporter with duplicated ATPase domains